VVDKSVEKSDAFLFECKRDMALKSRIEMDGEVGEIRRALRLILGLLLKRRMVKSMLMKRDLSVIFGLDFD